MVPLLFPHRQIAAGPGPSSAPHFHGGFVVWRNYCSVALPQRLIDRRAGPRIAQHFHGGTRVCRGDCFVALAERLIDRRPHWGLAQLLLCGAAPPADPSLGPVRAVLRISTAALGFGAVTAFWRCPTV